MDTHTKLENTKLSTHYFAVRWAATCLQQRVDTHEANGWYCDYDKYQLENLREVEAFLKDAWDAHFESMVSSAVEEVICG